MVDSPYMPGYEGWEVFDNLPSEIREAHNIVWTGNPHYTNQFRTNLCMRSLDKDTAQVIVELDGGRYMLAASDISTGACVFE
jgi:hypothetical protein